MSRLCGHGLHRTTLPSKSASKNSTKKKIRKNIIFNLIWLVNFVTCFFVERILDDWIFHFILCRTWYRMIWHASRYLSEQRSKSLGGLESRELEVIIMGLSGARLSTSQLLGIITPPPSSPNNPFTLPETNSHFAPESMAIPKGNLVFQPSIFGCELLVWGKVSLCDWMSSLNLDALGNWIPWDGVIWYP